MSFSEEPRKMEWEKDEDWRDGFRIWAERDEARGTSRLVFEVSDDWMVRLDRSFAEAWITDRTEELKRKFLAAWGPQRGTI